MERVRIEPACTRADRYGDARALAFGFVALPPYLTEVDGDSAEHAGLVLILLTAPR